MSDARTEFGHPAGASGPASAGRCPSNVGVQSPATTLPEFWTTPTADPPEQARPLGWLLVLPALLGLMIVPRRLGPRISRTGWGRTIAVHVFCLLVAGGIVVVGRVGLDELKVIFEDNFTLSERLRLPAVLLVDALRGFAAEVGDAYSLLAAIPAAHALCWLIGWLLMPFIAAGERPGRAYLRAVKLVLWSACCFVVLMLIVLAVRVANEKVKFLDYVPDELVWCAVVGVWLLWWTGVLLRLGARYAGPAEGPGWTARRPTCFRCGYLLTGLQADGRCPECGLEVAASLPAPRSLPQWAEAGGATGRLRRFLPTLRAALWRPQFFTTLAVYRGREAAIRFAAWWTWLVGLWCAANAVVPFIYDRVAYTQPRAWPVEAFFFVVLVLAVPVAVCRLLLAVLALLVCRFGWRDPRPTTIVTCYAAGRFVPTFLVAPLGVWFLYCISGLVRPETIYAMKHPYDVLVDVLVLLLLFGPPVVALVWGIRQYARALRAVRHAGA